MAEAAKDTIYIDIDDEITSIIDKAQASKHKIVALVLPKRATALQSIVNMKLLKRTGDELGKRVVLITSEAGLLPLAGAVGLYTAKTLQSKPLIPAPPELPSAEEAMVEADVPAANDPELDDSKSIGELAGLPDESKAIRADPEETIDIDNDAPVTAATIGGKAGKKNKKKLKIPDFNHFRTRLFLGIALLVLLIVGWIFANIVLPKAKVTVKADTSTITANSIMTADTTAKTVNTESGAVPAQLKQIEKTGAEQVAATGQKDNGTKASGVVSLKNCAKTSGSVTIPAGSGVSSGGFTYITQESVTLPASLFDFGGTCQSVVTKDANVVAQQNGDKYNLAAGQTFTVAGYSGVSGTNSNAMAGGISQIVKVVAQADIDAGKQKILDKYNETAKSELAKQFKDADYQSIIETFSPGTPKITNTPNVGDQGDMVTVNAVITYTMLGVKHDDLKKVIDAGVKNQIDIKKQPIQDYNFNQMVFTILEAKSPNQVKVSMQAIVIAGVKLDINDIKRQIAGKKKGDVQQIIGSQPGVKDVNVGLSPFWVSKVPKKTSRITIIFEQTNSNAKSQ